MSKNEKHGDSFETEVSRKANRRLKARHTKKDGAWFGLGMFGVVGWSVAIPTLAGIALGTWLDRALPTSGRSWTLVFLLAGVFVGCVNAWWWITGRRGD